MHLPNWAKIAWWLMLVGGIGSLVYLRHPDLVRGGASNADAFIFCIWVALLLVPLFSEISFFGIKLKAQLADLRKEVQTQGAELKSEIRAAVDVRNTFSPHFSFPAPPQDSQLPVIEERIKKAIGDALAERGYRPAAVPTPSLDVPERNKYLFSVRFALEAQLRRLAEPHLNPVMASSTYQLRKNRMVPMEFLRGLAESEVIDRGMANAIREVYSVCSRAIHGEQVTDAQYNFVKDVGPQLIATLSALDDGEEAPEALPS